jgi:hypothetical protein
MTMKMDYTDKTITIEVELKEHEAYAYAQYLKRVCYNDYRMRAYDDEDAYFMRDAGYEIRRSLADKGYSPR